MQHDRDVTLYGDHGLLYGQRMNDVVPEHRQPPLARNDNLSGLDENKRVVLVKNGFGECAIAGLDAVLEPVHRGVQLLMHEVKISRESNAVE